MNLIGNPWIPVLFNSGETKLVSLKELYEQSENISDLVLNPPQRISVMRLLICITQAALDGPKNEEDWKNCKNRISTESIKYLENRKDKFNLFGDKPFLQIKDESINGDYNSTVDALDFNIASGARHTLFDSNAIKEGRKRSFSKIVLSLITHQCFAPAGLIGVTNWAKKRTSKDKESGSAPCVEESPVHTIIIGENLSITIHYNLITKEQIQTLPNKNFGFGKPIWDNFPKGQNCSDIDKISMSYLGRLIPLSRVIKISNNCQQMILANGITYPKLPICRDTMLTTIKKKGKEKGKERIGYLSIENNKHIWRELNSILAIKNKQNQIGPLTLNHFYDNIKMNQIINLWTGGLQVKQKKLINIIEWNFLISVSQLGATELNKYEKGVEIANAYANKLRFAITDYFNIIGLSEFSINEKKRFSRNDKRTKETREKIIQKATSFFWQQLDNKYELLLEIANDDTKPMDEWEKLLYKTMVMAYEFACPKETPRQIQAYVVGKKYLTIKKNEKSN